MKETNPTVNDVIVIGAGHNGLVCAGYLAKAGLRVLVAERSRAVGGGCVTQELVPGYHFSTFAYGAHGPSANICRDLQIPTDAIHVETLNPHIFQPFPDGDYVIIWSDTEKTAAGLERFGRQEAAGYLAYQEFFGKAVTMASEWRLRPPMMQKELCAHHAGTEQGDILEAMLTRSHWDILGDYFNNEKIKCVLAQADDGGDPEAIGSLIGTVMESTSTGTGHENKSGIVHGGMGVITQALAKAAEGFGAKIQVDCPVERILIENSQAIGVQLSSGAHLYANTVISNADPKRTFLSLTSPEDLSADFRKDVANITTNAGYMKFHAILSDLPTFTALSKDSVIDPKMIAHARIAPSLDYFRKAWSDAQSGLPSCQPVMSLQIPTLYTPEIAPPGEHIFGAWVRYGPAKPQTGQWDEALRQQAVDNIVNTIEIYVPEIRNLLQWHRLYTPEDIERETSMPNGNFNHADQTLNQMLGCRPLPQWSSYRTPIDGLWLCGAGTHPGGSVTGGPGHNAAHVVLDHMKSMSG